MVKQWVISFGRWCKRYAKIILFSFFSIFLILTITTFLVPGKEYSESPFIPHSSQNIGPLQDGTKIEFFFESEVNGFSGVQLMFSTYARVNVGGLLHAEYSDAKTGEVIHTDVIRTEDLQDNEYYPIRIPSQADSKGKSYKLELYTENVDLGNAFTLWLGDPKEVGKDFAVINGEKMEQGLVSNLLVEKNKYRFLWELLVCTAGSFALWGIAPGREKKKREEEIQEEIQEEEAARGEKVRNLLKEKKKSILAAAVTVAALFLVSLAIEMVGFQYHLLFLDESKKGMITYSLPDMEQSGFAQENGQLTALRDDATLHVSFDKMYVNKLEYGYSSASEFKAQVLVDTYDGYGSPDQEEMTDSSASQLKRSVQNIRMDASGITLKVPEGTTITYFQINNQLQFNYLRFGFIFVVLLLIAALYAGRKIWARKVEAGFLLVAVAIGFLLLLLLPAKNVSWDEQIHFRTAYQQSFRSKVVWTESARQLKDVVEANAYSIEERADALEYMDEHADYSDPVRIEERGKVPYYKDYSYYSQSAFLLLGRKLNLPFSVCFRLGRMGNFLFYVFLMYLAVRNIKIGKRIMALIGLLPTPLFLSAVYSYDAVITACLMLAFSIIVNELLEPEKKLSFWNAFLFIGLVVFASLPKSVYVFFILLALMLPQSKFHSKSAKWIFKTGIVLIFFILMSTYLFAAVVDPVDAADIRGGDTDVSRQLGLVLGHPLTYLEILLKDMQKSMGSYVIGSASLLHYAYLGEYTAYNLQVVMAILIAFVVLTDTFEEKDGKMLQLRAGNRVFLALVILGSAVTIWTALYIAFTPVGTMYINGVQGRYYIPLLVPLFLLFRTSKLKNSINREVYHLILFGGAAFLSLFMIYQEVLKPLCY